ncbi:hypothetical protein EQM13_04780 [Acidilutibacter cellobiosedens]|jgi:hypothetical protein|uniref:Flp pilus assembly protein TadB n=1 Tax=Acidilutibacter cellobiosedens TaxID=2507161 RepID=A0A410QAP7_9FIRM|nr:hypothetical protein [Acidilutibacter cellobiosedens]MBE6081433.1 hypothetical protein [Tissierellaceae bacterium]QAT60944.1 hypothetical protein EQM13_04780 [Acidilutibacter cellobiosedens]
MNPIYLSHILIFAFISFAMLLLLKLNPFAIEQNPLKKRRLYLTGTKLKITEKIAIRFETLFRQTRCTHKKFIVMVFVSVVGGFVAGIILFGSTELAAVMAACMLPAPYFYLTVKSSGAAREEIEGLENMSIITNAYAGNDDIIKAVETYVEEKNRYIPAHLRTPTPFDEFVSEIRLINPNVEHGLYRLSAKVKNRYFTEWVKTLILCYHDRRLKFALFPIIKAMNDAKSMQIESDSMMVRVWRDYLMTAGLMFSIIPMMRFSNAEWFFILTKTPIGKLLIIIMLLTALGTAFYVMKATKPSNR